MILFNDRHQLSYTVQYLHNSYVELQKENYMWQIYIYNMKRVMFIVEKSMKGANAKFAWVVQEKHKAKHELSKLFAEYREAQQEIRRMKTQCEMKAVQVVNPPEKIIK